jgi:hypothetical protein
MNDDEPKGNLIPVSGLELLVQAAYLCGASPAEIEAIRNLKEGESFELFGSSFTLRKLKE